MPLRKVHELTFLWFGLPGPLLRNRSRPISEKEKTHKLKQICGIVPGLGGCQKVVYVFLFGSFLMGEKKHINKIPQKIPGQSRENFVYVFFSLCVLFAPYHQLPPHQKNPEKTSRGSFLGPAGTVRENCLKRCLGHPLA